MSQYFPKPYEPFGGDISVKIDLSCGAVVVVVITTSQLDSAKTELRFCAGSNPACGGLEIHDGDDL